MSLETSEVSDLTGWEADHQPQADQADPRQQQTEEDDLQQQLTEKSQQQHAYYQVWKFEFFFSLLNCKKCCFAQFQFY